MTKTPDETKKGLECCAVSYADCHKECPYKLDCDGSQILKDALALIQQLQADNADQADRIKQLEAERDAMKDEIDNDCETCKHCESCQEDGYCMWCENKESNKTPCCNCVYGSNWEWRGAQKEE